MLARESRRGGAGVAGVMLPRCSGAGRAAAGCNVPAAGALPVSAGARVSVRRPCSKTQRPSAHHQIVASCWPILTSAHMVVMSGMCRAEVYKIATVQLGCLLAIPNTLMQGRR